MKSVISNEKVSNHNIESYRFKVLSSVVAKEDIEDNFEEVQTLENEPKEPAQQENVAEPTNIQESAVTHNNSSKPMVEDAFVEKLLEKTDELSSNIIKLQMQIESQEAEFEKRLEEATSRAKNDGIEEGKQSALKEYEDKLSELKNQYTRSVSLLNEEQENIKNFLKKSENELSDIAIEISKEVIQQEIEKDSCSVALSLSKALMQELESATKIEIKVNPKDYEYLQEHFKEDSLIEVKSDEAISQGGVIILSDVGNLDGSISLRFSKIKEMAQE